MTEQEPTYSSIWEVLSANGKNLALLMRTDNNSQDKKTLEKLAQTNFSVEYGLHELFEMEIVDKITYLDELYEKKHLLEHPLDNNNVGVNATSLSLKLHDIQREPELTPQEEEYLTVLNILQDYELHHTEKPEDYIQFTENRFRLDMGFSAFLQTK